MMEHRIDLGFGLGSLAGSLARQACGGAIDLLGLEALVRMAIAADGNQLADATPACMVALAMQHEVDGFCGLRPHEAVVQIRPCTEGQDWRDDSAHPTLTLRGS